LTSKTVATLRCALLRLPAAGERQRSASQTDLTPSAKTATFYRKQAETQKVVSCPPGLRSYLQQ
jgi:hypothetical protein